jgi:alpha-galactosidase
MVGTLQKAKELGLEWAVLDDGWQNNEGDWKLDLAKKFPNGEADMSALVCAIKDAGLKARLWITPLAVDPGSDLLHDHTDMLLLDKDGAPQLISWWNSFYLCPAYQPDDRDDAHVDPQDLRRMGLPGHQDRRPAPERRGALLQPGAQACAARGIVEKLQDFWKMVYDTAREVNPNAVVELCPCGTSYAFHNFPYMNQAPASDPLSSWQVRHKGKTLKALMGPSAPYAGDHVELSDGGDDFASTIGIGAVLSTKFTWPVDPKPKDSFLLTPEREATGASGSASTATRCCRRASIAASCTTSASTSRRDTRWKRTAACTSPSTRRAGTDPWKSAAWVAGRWRLRDYVDGRDLGEVEGGRHQRLALRFEHALLLEAVPVQSRPVDPGGG